MTTHMHSPIRMVVMCYSHWLMEDSLSASNDCLVEDIQLSRVQATVHKLCIPDEQRLCLEASTREQNNELWHRERRCRITGSKCGRILNQKKRTEALLKFCLYPRPFDVIPKQIVWGRDCCSTRVYATTWTPKSET